MPQRKSEEQSFDRTGKIREELRHKKKVKIQLPPQRKVKNTASTEERASPQEESAETISATKTKGRKELRQKKKEKAKATPQRERERETERGQRERERERERQKPRETERD